MVRGDHVSGWRVIPYLTTKPDGSDPAVFIQVDSTAELGPSVFIVDGREIPTSASLEVSYFKGHIDFTGTDAEKLVRMIANSKTSQLVVLGGHIGQMKPKHGVTLHPEQIASFKMIVDEMDRRSAALLSAGSVSTNKKAEVVIAAHTRSALQEGLAEVQAESEAADKAEKAGDSVEVTKHLRNIRQTIQNLLDGTPNP
jgi:hypothetical protein